MGFRRLEENLIDLVKEQQAKLGFRPEVIRLYYPVSTLNHFFGSEDTAERFWGAYEGDIGRSPRDGEGRTVLFSDSGDRKCLCA